MRISGFVACASLLLTLAGCDGSQLALARPLAGGVAVQSPARTLAPITDCPPGWECVYATDNGGVDAITSILETNCNREGCGQSGIEPGSTSIVKDASGHMDALTGHCKNGALFSLLSNDTGCWDCTEGCAVAPVCPAGERCVAIPGSAGSDCRRFSCNAGYTLQIETAGFTPPTCRRELPPPPPAAPNVTATTTAQGRPRLQWSAVTGAQEYRIYRRLEWQGAAERWNAVTNASYTDPSTSVLGAPQSSPVTAQWAAYYVVSYGAGGEGPPSATFYYAYTGIAPY